MSAPADQLAVEAFPLIFAAPSGAGKTSLARALRERREDVVFSISATTRPPRSYERDGVDYFFRTDEQFRRMIQAEELLEWAEVHGNMYGTPRQNLTDAVQRGQHLILDIDVQGSRLVRERVPGAVSIFVLPPSGTELARRLLDRGSEDREVQRRRLQAARREIESATEFDYVIVNEDLERSVRRVEAIIQAERHATRRLPVLAEYVERLSSEVDQFLAQGLG